MGDLQQLVPPSISAKRINPAQPSPFFLSGGSPKYYEITKALWAANSQAMLLVELGKGRLSQNDWAGALSEFRKAIHSFERKAKHQPELAGEISKKIAECHGNCGCALLRLGDREGAAAEFSTALKLDSTCFEAHLYLGHSMLPSDPEGANLQYLLAFESIQNKILKYYDVKGELELDAPYACQFIAIAQSRLGKHDVAAVYYAEAAQLYRQEIKKHPEQEAMLSQLLALCEKAASQPLG